MWLERASRAVSCEVEKLYLVRSTSQPPLQDLSSTPRQQPILLLVSRLLQLLSTRYSLPFLRWTHVLGGSGDDGHERPSHSRPQSPSFSPPSPPGTLPRCLFLPRLSQRTQPSRRLHQGSPARSTSVDLCACLPTSRSDDHSLAPAHTSGPDLRSTKSSNKPLREPSFRPSHILPSACLGFPSLPPTPLCQKVAIA